MKKAKPEMSATAAFPDPAQPPSDTDLPAMLGRATVPVALTVDNLRAIEPRVTSVWQFSPRSGWYKVYLLKKRRLLYLVPRQDDFRLSMILGRKAVEQLKKGPYARQTKRVLKTAKSYPEGIAFTFDRKAFDLDLLGAFLAAKIAR
ncbi:MAG: DUF3788 family protein [Lacunisphaera sp.]|nr:DUF3788 family protein [Lacunisphaera sp.]